MRCVQSASVGGAVKESVGNESRLNTSHGESFPHWQVFSGTVYGYAGTVTVTGRVSSTTEKIPSVITTVLRGIGGCISSAGICCGNAGGIMQMRVSSAIGSTH